MIRILACAITLLLWPSLAGSKAMAQADAAPSAPRASEQVQAEIDFHKAEAKYYRELWEKIQTDNQELRGRIEGMDGPIYAKQNEYRQRVIDLEAQLYAKYVEAKQREYEFAGELMTVNTDMFRHQNIAAYVILALVVCVVLAALWFAHLQLMAGLAPAQAAAMALESGGDDSTTASGAPAGEARQTIAPASSLGTTSIDASFQKVTVTSSVVGVIVLVISLAFLYIYTKEVYTIRVVDPYQPKLANPAVPAESAQPKSSGEKKEP